MKAVTGNTYPVKDALKAMGGQWDKNRKLWLVPDDKIKEADALVANAPKEERKPLTQADIVAIAVRKRGGTPGICDACGAKCKYPYDECWDCKEERRMGY